MTWERRNARGRSGREGAWQPRACALGWYVPPLAGLSRQFDARDSGFQPLGMQRSDGTEARRRRFPPGSAGVPAQYHLLSRCSAEDFPREEQARRLRYVGCRRYPHGIGRPRPHPGTALANDWSLPRLPVALRAPRSGTSASPRGLTGQRDDLVAGDHSTFDAKLVSQGESVARLLVLVGWAYGEAAAMESMSPWLGSLRPRRGWTYQPRASRPLSVLTCPRRCVSPTSCQGNRCTAPPPGAALRWRPQVRTTIRRRWRFALPQHHRSGASDR
jgi:hypothetical protein